VAHSRIAALTLVIALAAFATAVAAHAQEPSRVSTAATFVVTGRGWGHGVGLSQCGAIGYARRGWKYRRILSHYYPGTEVTRAPSAKVRVLLSDGRRSVTIASKVAFRVRDADGQTYRLTAGEYELGPALRVRIDPDRPPQALRGPLTFLPGRLPLELGKAYRGSLLVKVVRGRLRAINVVGLEPYLYAVVPLEIGRSSPVEALKAQAVAARSYALATRGSGDFDLYADTRSQVYGGVDAEQFETTAAVDSTVGEVLAYRGDIIAAYYFASSGGRTAAVQDVWPGSRPIPYLVSVTDPYDSVCASVHRWGPFTYSERMLAEKLGVSGRLLDVRTVVNASHRVTSVVVRTPISRVSIPGARARNLLGLRSTWFRIGALALARPAAPAVYGTGIELTGVARGVGAATLQQRPLGGRWSRGERIRPEGDGTFAVRVRPRMTSDFRLTAQRASGPVLRVPVAPNVRLTVDARSGATGSVRPAFPGARIDLQRLAGTRWTPVASARLDEAGTFAIAARITPGTYRARVVPGARGYVAGASQPVRVVVSQEGEPARFAVGVADGTPLEELASRIESETDASVSSGDVALRALFVAADADSAGDLAGMPGVDYVERVDAASRRLAFTPNDPLAAKQWYLNQIRAFEFWPQFPSLPGGVLVAVLDSGIDGGHPEFRNRVAAARSFIGGSAMEDRRGHGTFVAGVIAAAANNATGIAGIAFPAELLVGKIARADRYGTVPLEAEARAVRWAVDNGARVINLSVAGIRDPFRTGRDTYSRLEASAMAYARRHGVVVVAAVGNSDQTPRSPWNYAGYPAALPHVLGVSALARDGSPSLFSNRDVIYNDVAAPGEDIFSTLPRSLAPSRCVNVGYSDCGPFEYRRAEGTSFAAPQVAAAAALIAAVKPGLAENQITHVLERSAQDIAGATGCRACGPSRDRFTGWGRLDIAAALEQALDGPLPRPDRYEANDDAGPSAWPLRWRRATLTATLDYWDDPTDVYRLRLRRGRRLSAVLRGPAGTDVNLVLWKPGTRTIQGVSRGHARQVATSSAGPGSRERIHRYRVRRGGSYYLEVRLSKPGAGPYSLSFAKR
jgi:stage II sporulation protein D